MDIAPTARPHRSDACVTVIALSGELDEATAPILRQQGCALIENGHRALVVDLSGVTSCDSSGLSALIGLWRCALESGGSLILVAVPDDLAALLERTGVDAVLTARRSVDDALSELTTTRVAAPAAS